MEKYLTIRFTFLLLILSFATLPNIAQTVGKIGGIAKDVSTKDFLPGVNVLIEGTLLVGASNANGEYYIINIPP